MSGVGLYSSLILYSIGTCTAAMHPYTPSCFRKGFPQLRTLYAGIQPTDHMDMLCFRYTTTDNANAKKLFQSPASCSMHRTHSMMEWVACSTTPLDWHESGIGVFCIMASNWRYSAIILEVYSLPTSVQNLFTRSPKFTSLRACHSFTFFMTSDLYFNVDSSICLVALWMYSNIHRPCPMYVSNGLQLSHSGSCGSWVEAEIVFRVHRVQVTWHLMVLNQ